VFNNLGHLFTYKSGPQNYYQKWFKHDIIPICIIDDNNLIHNINNYNNLQFCLRRLAVNKMATNIWRYSSHCACPTILDAFSIRLANIYSILSSINIYPLLNTVLKKQPERKVKIKQSKLSLKSQPGYTVFFKRQTTKTCNIHSVFTILNVCFFKMLLPRFELKLLWLQVV